MCGEPGVGRRAWRDRACIVLQQCGHETGPHPVSQQELRSAFNLAMDGTSPPSSRTGLRPDSTSTAHRHGLRSSGGPRVKHEVHKGLTKDTKYHFCSLPLELVVSIPVLLKNSQLCSLLM